MNDSATAALSPAEPAGAEGDNGASAGPEWTEGLNFSEETMGYIQNKGWKSPADVLQSYQNLEKFQGGSKNLVEVPGVDATDEQMASFYDRLGRPATASEYGFNAPEGADEGLMNWFGETAHRYGLSEKQAQGLFNEWNEMSTQKMENFQHELKVQGENDIAELKKEWGSDYDRNLNAGRLAANNLGYGEEKLAELESKLGTGEMLRLFATLGAKMGEDSFVSGNDSGGGFGTTPAQAAAQITELKADRQFMDAYMAGDRAAVDKMQSLMGKAYG